MSGFGYKGRINQKQTTQQRSLGPGPSYELTLDFPLSERQRLAPYLVRHQRGANVALWRKHFWGLQRYLGVNRRPGKIVRFCT